MDSLSIAMTYVKAFESKIGTDIKVLKVDRLTSLADYFVLVSGQSITQVGALADAGEEAMLKAGERSPRREGKNGESWILLDSGSVVGYIFTREARAYYQFEKLWADAEFVNLDEEDNK